MPKGDRTGPYGLVPMTGRGAGFCAGYPVPGYINSAAGRGSFGYGRGGGWRRCYYATGLPGWLRGAFGAPDAGAAYYRAAGKEPAGESETLKRERDFLKQGLKEIDEKLKELKKESGKG